MGGELFWERVLGSVYVCYESGPQEHGARSLPPCPSLWGKFSPAWGGGWRITNCLWKVWEVFLVITCTKSAGALCNWAFTLERNRGAMASRCLPVIPQLLSHLSLSQGLVPNTALQV